MPSVRALVESAGVGSAEDQDGMTMSARLEKSNQLEELELPSPAGLHPNAQH